MITSYEAAQSTYASAFVAGVGTLGKNHRRDWTIVPIESPSSVLATEHPEYNQGREFEQWHCVECKETLLVG